MKMVEGNGKRQATTQPTLRTRLESDEFRAAVAKVLPEHLRPERFVRICIMATTRTPKLANCDQASFFACLMTLSQLGLEPDGRRAHLIPFENRKRGITECQLIIDYKGLAELAYRSGQISKLHADLVCERDVFEYDRGEIVKHRIDFSKPRGAAYAAYAMCRMKDGAEKCEVMSRDEIEAVRNRSRASREGPWVTDWGEMAKKTVFRRLTKWIPMSPELQRAIEADDEFDPIPPPPSETAAALMPLTELLGEPEESEPIAERASVVPAFVPPASEPAKQKPSKHVPPPPPPPHSEEVVHVEEQIEQEVQPEDETQLQPEAKEQAGPDLDAASMSWPDFAAALWTIGKSQDIDPDVVNAAVGKLKLTDCGSSKRAAIAVRRRVLALAGTGRLDWAAPKIPDPVKV